MTMAGLSKREVTINKRSYMVDDEVADMLKMVSEQRNFYHKLLEIIAYEHLEYRMEHHNPHETLSRFRRLAHEGLLTYRD